jgi:Copper binding proteins, plastocyanin/azurin family
VNALPSNVFSPNDVSIAQGEKVTWNNVGGGTHNVRFDDGGFEMPAQPIPTAWSVQRTFNQVGDFTYYCKAHPTMTGIVRVGTGTTPAPDPGQPGGSSPGGTTPPPGGTTPSVPGSTETPVRPNVTFRASQTQPRAGRRIRLSGSVRPALDRQRVQIQRRTRTGSWKTIATTRLRDAGEERSTFVVRLRVFRDSVFRARVPAGAGHEAATSRRRRVEFARVSHRVAHPAVSTRLFALIHSRSAELVAHQTGIPAGPGS